MKNSTKFKIIRFVEKLLRYQQPFSPPIQSETRKIQIVQWEGIMYEYDVKYNLKEMVSSYIVKELIKTDIISIENEPTERHGEYKVYAKAFFIKPIQ